MMASSATNTFDFVTVDVFTESRFAGNPLAVVLVPAHLKDGIAQETKQRIAREFNLSETVFLHKAPDEADASNKTRQIDIFTIEEELPFAGHPTVGSAYLVLNHLKWSHVNTLLTKAGPIRISPEGRAVKAAISHAVHLHNQTLGSIFASAPAELDKVLGHALSDHPEIRKAELDGRPVSIVKGMTFLLVQLPSLKHLELVSTSKRLDFGAVPSLLDQGEWHGGFVARYYFVPIKAPAAGDGKAAWQIRTRMVELGFEDPATGSAACTLASYLTMRDRPEQGAEFEITQGVEMGRASQISVQVVPENASGGEYQIKDVLLGGTAVVVMSGSISV